VKQRVQIRAIIRYALNSLPMKREEVKETVMRIKEKQLRHEKYRLQAEKAYKRLRGEPE